MNIYWELHNKNYQRFNLTRLWKGVNNNPSKPDKKYIILGSSHSGFFRQKHESLDVIVYSIAELSEKSMKKLIDFYARDYELLKDYYSPDKIWDEYKALKKVGSNT